MIVCVLVLHNIGERLHTYPALTDMVLVEVIDPWGVFNLFISQSA